jgi:hypothetical protein
MAPVVQGEYEKVAAEYAMFDALERAKVRRAQALADRQELDNALKRGELIPVVYVRKWGMRFLVEARDEMMKAPGELQDVLAAESDPVKCAAILHSWVARVITNLHQTDRLWGRGAIEGEEGSA